MTIGDLYIVNYCHVSCTPLLNIMRLPENEAFALAYEMAAQNKEKTAFYRFADFENYYPKRLKTDELLYNRFVELGGKPVEKHPLSFVLQGSDYLDEWFDCGIRTIIPLNHIPSDRISFTYGDSMATLEKQNDFTMLTKEMFLQTMADYDGTVEKFLTDMTQRYHYIEVQIWDDEPLKDYLKENGMDTFDTIRNRTSYRGKYKNIPVPKADLIKILEAGILAPSGCNKQTTSFIAVDDIKLLDELKSLIVPPIAETAPAFILVLTQKIFAYRDKCFDVQDYSAAIENMLLAIKALGYESCWYEGHITDDDDIAGKIAKHMSIPDEYKIVCILPVGKPDEETHQTPRKPFESRAWFNGFGNSK